MLEFGHYNHNIKTSLKALTFFFKANTYFLEIRHFYLILYWTVKTTQVYEVFSTELEVRSLDFCFWLSCWVSDIICFVKRGLPQLTAIHETKPTAAFSAFLDKVMRYSRTHSMLLHFILLEFNHCQYATDR